MDLLTGSTGLVGSHLLASLLSEGRTVRALYRDESKKDFTLALIRYLHPDLEDKLSSVEWVQGDILDPDGIHAAMESIEAVHHTAAFVSFNPGDHKKLFKINVEGTANVLDSALQQNVKLFTFISSTATLPEPANGSNEFTADEGWTRKIGPSSYARSKFLAERDVWRASEEGLPVIIVNPAIILGPGNWHQSSSSIFRTVFNGLRFYPIGSNGFVDPRDVADAVIRMMREERHNERFLLSSGNRSFQDAFSHIAKAFDLRPPTRKVSPLLSEFAWRMEKAKCLLTGKAPRITKHSARAASTQKIFDGTLIEQQTDFSYRSFEQGISESAEWYKYAIEAGLLKV